MMEEQKIPSLRKKTLLKLLAAGGGLLICSFGIYMTIQANIGVMPWDTLCISLSKYFSITYGTMSVMISFIILGVDLILKERIGAGTLLDAILVGQGVDFFTRLNMIPVQKTLFMQIGILLAGLLIICFGQYVYMNAGLCCGPRDALLVALGKRVSKVPVGAINITISVTVLVIAWRLGGPIGIGTLIAACGSGVMMQLVFHLVHFDPYRILHEDLLQTAHVTWHN